ncbi:hypothetical protein BX600DRAFT_455272 [Xylariales sp. PMI_506]|nr:hypothetical protein BX600DRAFT_455272 [Xylariales sp. PMI_506]
MGIPGDSGAGIIDMGTDRLIGQLWGRNKYKGDPSESRLTYFTSIVKIFDDIQRRFPGGCTRPTLPLRQPVLRDSSTLRTIEEDAQTAHRSGTAGASAEAREITTISSTEAAAMVTCRATDLVVSRHANTWPKMAGNGTAN